MPEEPTSKDFPLNLDRLIEQTKQESSEREKDFPVRVSPEKDYGHGKIQVVQVIPESMMHLPPDELKKTRLLIYAQPWNVTGAHEMEKLQEDLQELAKNTQGTEPVRVLGIAYTGVRDTNSSKFVNPTDVGLPEGVKVTQLQVDKAKDIVAAIQDLDLIEGNNAEIMGFSAGGPIAQLSEALGVPVDTVGLMNASNLDNKGYGRTAARVVLESFANALIRHPKEYFDVVQRFKDKMRGHESKYHFTQKDTRPLKDRASRSLSENIAVGKSRTHKLIGSTSERRYIIGQTKWDLIYPRRRIRKVLRGEKEQNVTFVNLEGWKGHHMGATPARRRERLAEIGNVMLQARQQK